MRRLTTPLVALATLLLIAAVAPDALCQATATITNCKPGTGVRVYKHFVSVRAYKRLLCGSTVEVLNYSPGMVALVQQGAVRGYIQPWHIALGVAKEPSSALETLLLGVAQGLQAYGEAAMGPRERLARTCLATPGCRLDVWMGEQWTPVEEGVLVEQARIEQRRLRVAVQGTYYEASMQPLTLPPPVPSNRPAEARALVLEGDTLSLAIVNGYAYTRDPRTPGSQWYPLGFGPPRK